jgi:hypothetical protein
MDASQSASEHRSVALVDLLRRRVESGQPMPNEPIHPHHPVNLAVSSDADGGGEATMQQPVEAQVEDTAHNTAEQFCRWRRTPAKSANGTAAQPTFTVAAVEEMRRTLRNLCDNDKAESH